MVTLPPVTIGTNAVQVQVPTRGAVQVLIANESGAQLGIDTGDGFQRPLASGMQDVYELGDRQYLTLTPTLLTTASPPSSVAVCTFLSESERVSAANYPVAVVRQSAQFSEPGELGTIAAGVGTSQNAVFPLPAGTQSMAVKTVQTGGGSLTGSAILSVDDDDPVSSSLFFRQNPVVTNGWAVFGIVQVPTNAVKVTLDMTGVSGAGGQFTTTVVALPYSAAVAVTTSPGGSVAIKPSSGNLIMATGDTQEFYGSLANPAAGSAIVTTGTLPVGHYRVRVRTGYGLTADTIEDNVKLVLAGIRSYTNLRAPAVANGVGVDREFEFLLVDQSAPLHVEAIANHVAAGAVYWASLDVTPLSSS